MAKITLGPVIGEVTDTTARVLVEVDDNVQVTCEATDPDKNVVTQTVSFTKDRPSVFKLQGLSPETEYDLTFKGVTAGHPRGRVRTFKAGADRLNVAAVSCNFLGRRGETDLWADLRDRYVIPGDVDLLLHLGDQIYGDATFARALKIIRGKEPRSKTAQDEQILEAYRRLYRVWWTEPSTRDVLANVSNLMIWDDHEIRDDWGSRREDSDPDSAQYRVGTLARQVYREYQRQLWEDPPHSDAEEHFHVWGSIGVLFVDQRGGRSFGRDAARP
ncbi:MAG TPA: alkaline phosphatase D family protein, partial [Pyrinomonadaceae bacterium]|nr:alkaline phosphatase D family protein [Pyrinomonadaceae bacterium]